MRHLESTARAMRGRHESAVRAPKEQKNIYHVLKVTRKSLNVIFLQLICHITQKQRLKSKKLQEWNPPKMSQIIKRNHKKHNFFFIFFNIYFLPLGQKICRLQSSGNLHWYLYPKTFQKNKKLSKSLGGEDFDMLAPGL